MHAKYAQLRLAQFNLRHRRATRFQAGQVQHVMGADIRLLPHQYRVAMPAHRIDMHVQRHRLILAHRFQQPRRDGGRSNAKSAIRFLQRDHVRVQLSQHLQHSFGAAAAVGANGFADIIAGNA